MSRVAWVAGLFLLTAVAGCISDDGPMADGSVVEVKGFQPDLVLGTGDGHDHADVEAHLGSFNMGLVAWAPLVPEDEIRSTGFTEPWLVGDRAYIATQGANPGFLVADVSDPYAPTLLGQYETGDNLVWDVKATEDNRFAFLGAQLPSWALQQRPPTEEGDLYSNGVHAVDVSDPTNPTMVAYYPLPPIGGHNVFTYTHEGRYLVLATNLYDVQVLEFVPGPAGTGSFVHLAQMEATEGVYGPAEAIVDNGSPFFAMNYLVHDVYVEAHPVTGQLLAYAAWWDHGLRIFDLSIPEAPIEIGVWKEFDETDEGNLHYAQPHRGMIGDVHVTVTGPEFTVDDSDGYVNVLDTTDPRNPKKLAQWNLPGDNFQLDTGTFSAHNMDAADGRVALGAYHSGLWVLEIADLENGSVHEEPEIVGYTLTFTDDPGNLVENGTLGKMRPNLWGARLHDGLVWGADTGTGLHVFAVDEARGWDDMVDADGSWYVPRAYEAVAEADATVP